MNKFPGVAIKKNAAPFFAGRRSSQRASCAPLSSGYWSAAAAKAHQEHDHKDDQEYEKQNFRDPDRSTRDAGEPEHRGNKAEDQERNCPT
jgi:hypothetical protein